MERGRSGSGEVPAVRHMIVVPGQMVKASDRDTEWPQLVFETCDRGSGWVPHRLIEVEGERGIVLAL